MYYIIINPQEPRNDDYSWYARSIVITTDKKVADEADRTASTIVVTPSLLLDLEV